MNQFNRQCYDHGVACGDKTSGPERRAWLTFHLDHVDPFKAEDRDMARRAQQFHEAGKRGIPFEEVPQP